MIGVDVSGDLIATLAQTPRLLAVPPRNNRYQSFLDFETVTHVTTDKSAHSGQTGLSFELGTAL